MRCQAERLRRGTSQLPIDDLNDGFIFGTKVIRYDTRCYFNVRSKAGISQLNLPHETDN